MPAKYSGTPIEYQGRKQTQRQWAEEFGIPYKLLRERMNKGGKSLEQALLQEGNARYSDDDVCSVAGCGKPIHGKGRCQYHYHKQHRDNRKANNLPSVMLSAAKQRARTGNIPFTITTADFSIPDVCPVLKIPLRYSSGGATANSPSLDKINPAKGYVPGNVRVISYRANILKNDATPAELRAIADDIEQYLDHW